VLFFPGESVWQVFNVLGLMFLNMRMERFHNFTDQGADLLHNTTRLLDFIHLEHHNTHTHTCARTHTHTHTLQSRLVEVRSRFLFCIKCTAYQLKLVKGATFNEIKRWKIDDKDSWLDLCKVHLLGLLRALISINVKTSEHNSIHIVTGWMLMQNTLLLDHVTIATMCGNCSLRISRWVFILTAILDFVLVLRWKCLLVFVKF